MSTFGIFPKSKSEGTLSGDTIISTVWSLGELQHETQHELQPETQHETQPELQPETQPEHRVAYNIIIEDMSDEIEKLTEQVRKLRYSEHKLQDENEKLLNDLQEYRHGDIGDDTSP
jgi:predicted RNase H-like nuclease (RuvC/YqgF family)